MTDQPLTTNPDATPTGDVAAPQDPTQAADSTPQPTPAAPAPADPPPAPDAQPIDTTTSTPAAIPPAPAAQPVDTSTPAADVGDVVTYQADEDAPETRGLVVGTVAGAEHRDEGLLVVPLADAVFVSLDAIRD